MAHYITDANGNLIKVAGNFSPSHNILRYDLIWTNPNPLNTFSAQTITLNKSLSSYNYYVITFSEANVSNTIFFSTGLVPVGKATTLFNGNSDSVYNNIISRMITSITDTTITFKDAYALQNNSNVPVCNKENGRDIPLEVYGVKFGG